MLLYVKETNRTIFVYDVSVLMATLPTFSVFSPYNYRIPLVLKDLQGLGREESDREGSDLEDLDQVELDQEESDLEELDQEGLDQVELD